MEAHGVREHPPGTAARPVRPPRPAGRRHRRDRCPRFADAGPRRGAGRPAAHARHGRAAPASICRPARTTGSSTPPRSTALRALWGRVLGEADLRALDGLFARLIWIPDGSLDELDQAAREYRAIVGPPDPPHGDGAGAAPAARRHARERHRLRPGRQRAGGGVAGRSARARPRRVARGPARTARRGPRPAAGARAGGRRATPGRPDAAARGTGRPSGRMPDRGVDRPPVADEVAQARRYATRLRRALTAGTRRVDKRTPGGRFDGRAYTRAPGAAPDRAARQHATRGRSPGSVTAPIRAAARRADHRHLRLDGRATSTRSGRSAGSSPTALRQVGGRCATALFGNARRACSATARGRLPLVPGIRTGGGTAFAGDAIELAAERLEMTNPRRPRFVYVLSDGGWADTQGRRREDALARRARRPHHPPRDRHRAARRSSATASSSSPTPPTRSTASPPTPSPPCGPPPARRPAPRTTLKGDPHAQPRPRHRERRAAARSGARSTSPTRASRPRRARSYASRSSSSSSPPTRAGRSRPEGIERLAGCSCAWASSCPASATARARAAHGRALRRPAPAARRPRQPPARRRDGFDRLAPVAA